jgi:flagella basal body P-ring formation protein FlgA
MTARLAEQRSLRQHVLAGILTLCAGALTFGAHTEESSSRWQPAETIAAAARAAAAAADAGDVEAVGIDDRLKLSACGGELEARVERAIVRGQGTIAVSCAGPNPWRLFVPVRTTQQVPVLVLTRNVQAGEVLTAGDLATERRAVQTLPYDHLSDASQAQGLMLRRTQTSGTVLVAAALERPEVVSRGALVTIIAGAGPVTVKSDGVALESARLGQRLRIRSASGRVIEGTAEGPGQVRVGT